MFHQLHPDDHLREIRQRHAHLRRQAEHSRHFRDAGRRHLFRGRGDSHRRRSPQPG